MSNAKKNREIRELARRFARVVEVNDGDVILIKRDPTGDVINRDIFDGLASAFASTNRSNCIVVYVNELADVTVLDEKQMEELGWVRKEEGEDESPINASS